MPQIRTLNVIEYFDGEVQNVTSFTNDQQGQNEAHELFVKLARENCFDESEIDAGLGCDCFLKQTNYELFLNLS